MTHYTYLIIGGGMTGSADANGIREEDSEGTIGLISTETHMPYDRPPLSKDYLMGRADRDATFVHPRHWYADHGIDLRTGDAVDRIDPAGHEVTLADGSHLGYRKLLLTTGSSPRRLDTPGAVSGRGRYLRRLDDSDRIKTMFRTASRVAIIGGGWIGLETAAAARAAGSW